jgi:hypothetical protein
MLLREAFPLDFELEAIAEPPCIHVPLHNPEVLIADLDRWGSRVGVVWNCIRSRLRKDINVEHIVDFPVSREFQSVC